MRRERRFRPVEQRAPPARLSNTARLRMFGVTRYSLLHEISLGMVELSEQQVLYSLVRIFLLIHVM